MNNASYKCIGCYAIDAKIIDDAAWQKTVEIICNPSIVDAAVVKRRTEDPTARRRKQINKDLANLRAERSDLQATLLRMIKERALDRNTEGILTNRLKELERLEHKYNSELLDDSRIQELWDAAQRKLEMMHQKCAIMREKLKDPAYELDYKTKRDFIEFLGITATIWERGHNPRFRIEVSPPDIVSSHQLI